MKITVKDLARKIDNAIEDNANSIYAEDMCGRNMKIKKVVVNKTRVTLTAQLRGSWNQEGLTVKQVEQRLMCAGAQLPIFVVLPGEDTSYYPTHVSNGCAGTIHIR